MKPLATFVVLVAVSKSFHWLYRLGGVGFILLGVADNSIVPLPGSMDALLIVLAAHKREWWWYYALFATAGSVLGGYLTYRLARLGGKETLEKKISKKRAERAYHLFDRYGFATLFFGAIAPPPTPIVPFLMTAGVMQYPLHKFLVGLGSGRFVRFLVVGWVAHRYGRQIFSWLSRYYKPALWTLIALAVVGGIIALVYYLRWRARRSAHTVEGEPQQRAA